MSNIGMMLAATCVRYAFMETNGMKPTEDEINKGVALLAEKCPMTDELGKFWDCIEDDTEACAEFVHAVEAE